MTQPTEHVPLALHTRLVPQVVPSAAAGCAHVPVPLHASLVHGLLSSGQANPEGVFSVTQVPDWHW